MAAANSSATCRGVAKRFVNQAAAVAHALAGFRRTMYTSVYDKNIDEHVRPAVVPDNVIHQESDKYWGPHPNTGVFGPLAEGAVGSGERGFHSYRARPSSSGGYESVLEEKAFFRPLEDLDIPQHS
ncbi:hypothetical protein V2J09_009014 [Rumex salicifolius]